MSPALEAAMATTVPAVTTAAFASGAVQPKPAKHVATPSSVISVMPEVGCDETPTRPTMRAATATKRTPKIATPAAQTARCGNERSPAKTPGTSAQVIGTNAMAVTTNQPGRSSLTSVRRKPLATAAKAVHIV